MRIPTIADVSVHLTDLSLIWMGNLGVFFEVGKGKITPYLKLFRIKLETQILAHKYTIICSFRKYIF